MLKNITIGILLLALIIGGTLWYRHYQNLMNAEPTKTFAAPETPTETGHWHGDEWHEEPHENHETTGGTQHPDDEVVAEEEPIVAEPTQPRRKTIWNSLDIHYPPEGAPRPLKHLTNRELHDIGILQPAHLTDEDVIQAQYEIFFRMPKEMREDIRQQRIDMRAQRDFNERIGKEIEKLRP